MLVQGVAFGELCHAVLFSHKHDKKLISTSEKSKKKLFLSFGSG